MALDIVFGDLLTDADSKEYPVRGVEIWRDAPGTGMVAMMTETYGTKRAPAISGGKRGAAASNLSDVAGTPLLPVAPEMEVRAGLPHGAQVFEVFLQDTSAVVRVLVDDVQGNR